MQTNKATLVSLIVGLLCVAAVLSVYVVNRDRPLGEKHKTVDQYGGEFTLVNGDGHPVSLKDFRGKIVVAYFGFLNCTEACPASMAVLRAAYKKMTPEELAEIQSLFISVDPDRDSIEDLKAFTDYHNGLAMALTGTKERIKELTRKYGVFFELKDLEGSAMAYTIDHSSRFYMIGRDGKLVTTMSHSTTPKELSDSLRRLLRSTSAPQT